MLVGAGGYSGGAGIPISLDVTINGGKNGEAGGHESDDKKEEYYYAGGGYFSGPDGIDVKQKDRKTLCLGGFFGQGNTMDLKSSTGGKGGEGGLVTLRDYAKVTAENGNSITDNSSSKPLVINSQDGFFVEKYEYKKVEGIEFTLKQKDKKKKVKVNDYGQGMGSGAGYLESSNGRFRDHTAQDK